MSRLAVLDHWIVIEALRMGGGGSIVRLLVNPPLAYLLVRGPLADAEDHEFRRPHGTNSDFDIKAT